MKKVLLTLLSLTIIASLFAMSSSATEQVLEVLNTDNVVLDGVIEEGEYSASYTLNKDVVDSLGGDAVWVGSMPADMSATFNLAWTNRGLLVGVEIVGDRTLSFASDWDAQGDTNKHPSDCIQINLYSDMDPNYWFSIGTYSSGSIAARTHGTTEDCGFTDDLSGKVLGYSNRTTSKYTVEFEIPWEYATNGTTHAANPELGEEFAILFAYIDRAGSNNEVAFKSASVFPGNGADIPLKVKLSGSEEVPTQTPTVADDPTDIDAPTSDSASDPAPASNGCGSAVLSTAAVISMACAVAVVLKKKF